jgi:Ca2+-binding EF-hand superfamily protein
VLLNTSASFLQKLLLSFFLATDLPSFVAVSGHEQLRAKYRFRKVTGKDHTHLTREQFTALLGPSPCTEGLFKYVDTDGDGTVSFNEIHKEITAFRSIKSPQAKLQGEYPAQFSSLLSKFLKESLRL